MSAKRSNHDQRKSFRCAVADSRRCCQLKIGDSVLPAAMLDESAGGFSVLVERLPDLSAGQTAVLHTKTGTFDVRVVHGVQVEAAEAASSVTGVPHGPWFRLGLSRLGETSPPQPPRASLFAGSLHVRLGQWCPTSAAVLTIGVLLAVTIVLVPAELLGVGWRSGRWDASGTLKSLVSGIRFDLNSGSSRSNNRSQGTAADSRHAGESERSSHESGSGNQSAGALAMPEVVRDLNLTGAQQEQIRQLNEATFEAMRALDAQVHGQDRQTIAQLRTQLFDESYRQALKILTDQQRAQWQQRAANP
jgi:hypothetical protein